MDMKINGRLVQSERERRAWSQQHLATVSGLGLRTVQRIERTGSASYESVKALASCLDLSISQLRIEADRALPVWERLRLWKVGIPALIASFLTGAVVVSIQSVAADQILLDIGVELSGRDQHNEYKTQVLMDAGENIELPMDGIFRLVVTPSIMVDGSVAVSFAFYEYRNEHYELLSAPRLVTPNGVEAEIVIQTGDAGEKSYRVAVTPRT